MAYGLWFGAMSYMDTLSAIYKVRARRCEQLH
jgi:hypothetical protein